MLKFFLSAFFLFLPFAQAGEVLTPEGRLQEPVWTLEEQEAGISRKLIKNTPGSSSLWIRLKTAELPHTHNDHDLTVVIVRGKAAMHLGGQTQEIKEGDIVEIPRGVVHSAENTGAEPCLVYAVFTPLLDGTDYYPA